ncbi:MAG: hypothetical protein HY731_06910 [Candidatus Tectomicrobia bacterium]|nr:hypothetical protein [Candidatus Tectomicrobia bacterium]
MLSRLWQWWKRIAEKIGNFQARLLLSLFYFVVILPMGLVVRLSSDPLKLRKGQGSLWIQRESSMKDLDEARRQF